MEPNLRQYPGLFLVALILIAFTHTLTAQASSIQSEYSSLVAQMIIDSEKSLTESHKPKLKNARGYQSRIVLLRVSSGEPDLSECEPEQFYAGPYGKYTLLYPTVDEAEKAVTVLKDQENVIYAEQDSPVISCARTIYPEKEYEFHTWAAIKMGFPEILDMCSVEASGSVLIAVIDSGVAEHKQLRPRIAKLGFDYVENDLDPTNDGTGHGTHVAGIIVDCTPSLSVNLMPIRVLNDSGGGRIANAVNAIDEAVDAGCSIINLSLVSPNISEAFDDAVIRAISKGVTVVVAAGNNGSNTSNYSPVHLGTSGLIVVGAVDSGGGVASYSNYGSSVDLFAYGTGISSCAVSGSYVTKTGTSMAAPHISAACAILHLLHRATGPSACEAKLKALSRDSICPIPILSSLAPTDIGLNTSQLTVCVGNSLSLLNSAMPESSGLDLTWTSGNEDIVSTVDNIFKANKAGTTTLTVNCSKWSITCSVVVIDSQKNDALLILPDAIAEIGDEAFMGDNNIRIAILGNNAQVIGNDVFSGCSALETVFIPSGVTSIGKSPFAESTIVVNKNCYAHEWVVANEQPYIIDTGQ